MLQVITSRSTSVVNLLLPTQKELPKSIVLLGHAKK